MKPEVCADSTDCWGGGQVQDWHDQGLAEARPGKAADVVAKEQRDDEAELYYGRPRFRPVSYMPSPTSL